MSNITPYFHCLLQPMKTENCTAGKCYLACSAGVFLTSYARVWYFVSPWMWVT